jgi:hypothetical protein
MKRILTGIVAITLLSACTAQGAEQRQADTTAQTEVTTEASATSEIWTTDKTPTKVRYDRMWEYSASGETDDPAFISALVTAIKNLKVGNPNPIATDDFTDFVSFTFEGETEPLKLQFEDQCWVKDQKTRYEVEGIRDVRQLLDQLIDEDTI